MADDGVSGPGGNGAGSAPGELRRPVTILVGPSGSGKTEIAVNLAMAWQDRGAQVTLVDLDLVKPYFRCRLAKADLAARGVRLAAPAGDRFYADLPILVPEARAAGRLGPPDAVRVVFDVGGDDLGARPLGSLADVLDPAAADLLFVVNTHRPFADDLASLRRALAAIQRAARMAVTGLVANTHLMDDTLPETVRHGLQVARDLEAATGIPLRFGAALARLAWAFPRAAGTSEIPAMLFLERYILPPFGARPPGAGRRSAVV